VGRARNVGLGEGGNGKARSGNPQTELATQGRRNKVIPDHPHQPSSSPMQTVTSNILSLSPPSKCNHCPVPPSP